MKRSKQVLFFVFILIPVCAAHAQQPPTISLWPDGAPGANPEGGEEAIRIQEPTGDHVITNVHRPSITPYLPPEEKATGIAIVIAPFVLLKFKTLNVPAELHIYATAHHGFGIRPGDMGASAQWPAALIAWLYDIHGIGSDG